MHFMGQLKNKAESYFDFNVTSTGVLPNVCEALQKYGLFDYARVWFDNSVFPVYSRWKATAKRKVSEKPNEV